VPGREEIIVDEKERADITAYLTMLGHRGIWIIVSVCMVCGEYLGCKDGRGVSGISHGLCDNCRNTMEEGI
jgi:hypothetical protein